MIGAGTIAYYDTALIMVKNSFVGVWTEAHLSKVMATSSSFSFFRNNFSENFF
jgi:hypothetical protein